MCAKRLPTRTQIHVLERKFRAYNPGFGADVVDFKAHVGERETFGENLENLQEAYPGFDWEASDRRPDPYGDQEAEYVRESARGLGLSVVKGGRLRSLERKERELDQTIARLRALDLEFDRALEGGREPIVRKGRAPSSRVLLSGLESKFSRLRRPPRSPRKTRHPPGALGGLRSKPAPAPRAPRRQSRISRRGSRKRARDYGDDPGTRGGKERRIINWRQPWEARHARGLGLDRRFRFYPSRK